MQKTLDVKLNRLRDNPDSREFILVYAADLYSIIYFLSGDSFRRGDAMCWRTSSKDENVR